MNQSADAPHSSRENGRRRSESTHPEDYLWLEFLIDRATQRKAFRKTLHKSEDSRRQKRWETDRRQFFESKLRSRGKGQAVDLFFGNEQKHFVSALPQHFGHGNSRKKMPTRAAACDDRVHEIAVCGDLKFET